MTEQQAQALALLVGGRVVGGKVYVPKPRTSAQSCVGCAFRDAPIKDCSAFGMCFGQRVAVAVAVEVPHD